MIKISKVMILIVSKVQSYPKPTTQYFSMCKVICLGLSRVLLRHTMFLFRTKVIQATDISRFTSVCQKKLQDNTVSQWRV